MKERCEGGARVRRRREDGDKEDSFGAIIIEGEDNFLPPLAGERTFPHLTPPLPLHLQEGVAFNTQLDDDQSSTCICVGLI
jgi:hypothetical protein